MKKIDGTEISFQEIKKRTIRSIGARFPIVLVTKALNLIEIVILMILLEPRDFGILAFASFIVGIAFIPLMGWGSNVVQLKEKTNELLTIHTFFNFCITVAIGLILIFLRGILSTFFEAPYLGPVILVIIIARSVYSLFSGANLSLVRDVKDYELVLINFGGAIIEFIATIILAILDFSFWSLIIGPIPGAIFANILILIRSHWKPTKIGKQDLLLYLKSGSSFSLLALLYWLTTNADDGIVGKMLGETQLGFYSTGYRFGNLLTYTIAHQTHTVMFPSYARTSSIEDLRKMFVRIIEFIAILTIPITILGVIYCRELVLTVFGAKWLPIIPIIQGFLIYSLSRGISGPIGPVFEALGKLKPLIMLQIFIVLTLITAGIFLTSIYGLMGIIALSIVLEVFSDVICCLLVKKEIGVNILKEINKVIAASALMGILITVLKLFTEILWIFQIVAGIFIYFLLLYKLRKNLIQDYLAIIKTGLKGESL